MAPGSAGTFGALAKRYLDEYSRRRKRSSEGDERNFANTSSPNGQRRRFAGHQKKGRYRARRRHCDGWKPTLANRVQSLISGVFTFAIDADLTEAESLP